MPDPINYQALLTQLDVSPLMHLQQVQAQKREVAANEAYRQQQIAALRDKAQVEATQRAAYDTDMRAYLANPSSANLTGLIAKYPDQHQALRLAADQQDKAVKNRNLQAAMTLGGYVSAGQTDKALDFARRRREALANAGEAIDTTDTLIGALEGGDLATARGIAGLVIASSADPEQTAPILAALGWDAASRRAAVDDQRADAQFAEMKRHNLVTEGQAATRVGLSAAAGARADRKAATGGKPKSGAYTNAQLDGMLN